MNYEAIDNRIESIMKKAELLSTKNPEFSCCEFPPKWEKPLSEKPVFDYENKNKIKLPSDYRRFITTVTRAGTQPFYGLISLLKQRENVDDVNVSAPFPYKISNPLYVYNLSDEEYDNLYKHDENDRINPDAGYIALCDEGCAMYNILIINSEDEETYGTMWFYDLANDFGIVPIMNPKTNKPMHFLDWFEYWVDITLEEPEEEFMSYGELGLMPESSE